MRIDGANSLISGTASGPRLASAKMLAEAVGCVAMLDRDESFGRAGAKELRGRASFIDADGRSGEAASQAAASAPLKQQFPGRRPK